MHRVLKGYRIVFNSDIDNLETFLAKGVWVWLLREAKHAPEERKWKNRKIILQPGQLIVNVSEVSRQYKIPRTNLRRILDQLKDFGWVEVESSKYASLITITDYGMTQYDAKELEKSGQQTANPRPTSGPLKLMGDKGDNGVAEKTWPANGQQADFLFKGTGNKEQNKEKIIKKEKSPSKKKARKRIREQPLSESEISKLTNGNRYSRVFYYLAKIEAYRYVFDLDSDTSKLADWQKDFQLTTKTMVDVADQLQQKHAKYRYKDILRAYKSWLGNRNPEPMYNDSIESTQNKEQADEFDKAFQQAKSL